LQEQQQEQETRGLALRCLLDAAGTNEDERERERGARAPGGPEERGVPVSLSPVRPVARGQSLVILRKHSGQKEQDPNGVTYEVVDWDVDVDGDGQGYTRTWIGTSMGMDCVYEDVD
jgi:hypothetical protein